jgi:hypothetical protein
VDEAIRSFGDTLGELQHGVVVEVENVRQGIFLERKKIPESTVNSGLLEDMERLGSEMEGYVTGFEEEGGRYLMQGKSWLFKTVAASMTLLRTVDPFSTVIPSSSPGAILVPVK